MNYSLIAHICLTLRTMFNSSVGVRKLFEKPKKLKNLKNQKINLLVFCFLQWQYIDYITLTPLVALNLPLHLVSPCGHVLLPFKKINKFSHVSSFVSHWLWSYRVLESAWLFIWATSFQINRKSILSICVVCLLEYSNTDDEIGL